MLVYKDNIEVKSLNKGMCDTFKYALWQLNSGHKIIKIMGIYRPLPKSNVTKTKFID